MSDALSWTAPAGGARSGELRAAPAQHSPRPAVVLLTGRESDLDLARDLAMELSRQEWSTLLVDRSAAMGDSDRENTAEIEAALAALGAASGVDEDALALIGIGPAGTQAFLCACASRRVAALVDLCGSLERAELNATQPVQPLDMALNLTAPILIVHSEQDPKFGSEAAGLAAQRLNRAMRSVEVLQLPLNPTGFPDGGEASYHPDHAGFVSRGITSFLEASFDSN